LEKGSRDRLGGGNLRDYLINSNTFASSFVTNVCCDKDSNSTSQKRKESNEESDHQEIEDNEDESLETEDDEMGAERVGGSILAHFYPVLHILIFLPDAALICANRF